MRLLRSIRSAIVLLLVVAPLLLVLADTPYEAAAQRTSQTTRKVLVDNADPDAKVDISRPSGWRHDA